jgi:phage gp46-like protein
MVDKELIINDEVDMNFSFADSLKSNIFLSIMLPYNSIIDGFGSRLNEIKKASIQNLELAKLYVRQSLAWLITANKVEYILVEAAYDKLISSRLNILITVKKNNVYSSYSLFYNVI